MAHKTISKRVIESTYQVYRWKMRTHASKILTENSLSCEEVTGSPPSHPTSPPHPTASVFREILRHTKPETHTVECQKTAPISLMAGTLFSGFPNTLRTRDYIKYYPRLVATSQKEAHMTFSALVCKLIRESGFSKLLKCSVSSWNSVTAAWTT